MGLQKADFNIQYIPSIALKEYTCGIMIVNATIFAFQPGFRKQVFYWATWTEMQAFNSAQSRLNLLSSILHDKIVH